MIDRTYRISDVVSEDFLRFPLTLLANPKYKEMSLEAKFIYSLLLNRLTLSQKNNWINEDNEVYLIYTREDAANTLKISYRKAIAAFKELIEAKLLYEERQGRGYPNLLYVLKAEVSDEEAIEFSEEFYSEPEENEEKEPENPDEIKTCNFGISRTANIAYLDMQNLHIKNCKNGTSRTAEIAGQDMPILHPRNINNINTENSVIDNSQSIHPSGETLLTDGPTDNQILKQIYENCSLDIFSAEIRIMFQNAIDRIFYSESVKVGNAVLPREKVRSLLWRLEFEHLSTALQSMTQNEDKIKNPTAYLISTIINAVCEEQSDLILNLPPGYVDTGKFYETEDN